MGYLSDFFINVELLNNDDLDTMLNFLGSKFYFSQNGRKIVVGSVKWYDFEEELKELSKSFSKDFFVTVYGEDRWDIHRFWFKNGKSFKSIAKLQFEEPKW
jgi:hypothetical protein